MIYTDKDGIRVDLGYLVFIPIFPEYADKVYEIVGFPNCGDMYELSEIDEEGAIIPDLPVISVEPWKVELFY